VRAAGFAQKVDPIWNEPVSTGSAGALARRSVRSTLNLKLFDAVTVSRFALIAGEGARAPSISLSLSAVPLFGQGQLEQIAWNDYWSDAALPQNSDRGRRWKKLKRRESFLSAVRHEIFVDRKDALTFLAH